MITDVYFVTSHTLETVIVFAWSNLCHCLEHSYGKKNIFHMKDHFHLFGILKGCYQQQTDNQLFILASCQFRTRFLQSYLPVKLNTYVVCWCFCIFIFCICLFYTYCGFLVGLKLFKNGESYLSGYFAFESYINEYNFCRTNCLWDMSSGLRSCCCCLL